MTRLEVAPRAEAQIRCVSAWWRANRQAAPQLFASELATALEALLATPALGVVHVERHGVAIRRVLLPRSRYHVYFAYDDRRDLIEVRAVWGAVRGRGPSL